VIMPPIGMLLGGVDFTDFFITLSSGSYETLAAAKEAGAVTLNYGAFFNTVISFIIVAFAVFILIKQVNRFTKKEEEAPAEPAPPPREEVLLEEIRDLLKNQK
jgi:large conductance mechanosensitive channel